MDYIIYTTEGCTELPIGTEVNNCQIVDFIENSQSDKFEVLKQAAQQFNLRKDKMSVMVVVDEQRIEAIRQVIKYLWNDEQRHYEETENKDNHIFNYITNLAEYFGK